MNREELSDEIICRRITEEIKRNCGKFDVMLYCIPMNQHRVEISEVEAIRHLTSHFGEAIWKRAVFVLTHANEFRCRSGSDTIDQFHRSIDSFKEGVKKALAKAGVDPAIGITIAPAGFYESSQQDINPKDQWHLPGYDDDWLSFLWVECTNKLDDEPLLAMVAAASDRLVEKGTHQERNQKTSARNIELNENSEAVTSVLRKLMRIGGHAWRGIKALGKSILSFFKFWR